MEKRLSRFLGFAKHGQQKLFDLIKEEFFSDVNEEMKDAFTSIMRCNNSHFQKEAALPVIEL
ncbi:hypothetical protein AB1K84_20180 [Mesobacillus foraminis]|uniref:hypothetical protein n=1 Tax=Mesobacillus foraminis TaxID=279826 RepID=UPI0039A0FD11